MSRTCKISAQNGQVVVKLSVNNALISGGDFKIYDFNTGHVNESFKIQTDVTGSGSHNVIISAADLVGQVLSWQVLTCAPVITNSGTLTIEIFQNNAACDITPPASYPLNNVPNCSLNQSLPVQGGLHFIS